MMPAIDNPRVKVADGFPVKAYRTTTGAEMLSELRQTEGSRLGSTTVKRIDLERKEYSQ